MLRLNKIYDKDYCYFNNLTEFKDSTETYFVLEDNEYRVPHAIPGKVIKHMDRLIVNPYSMFYLVFVMDNASPTFNKV